MATLYGYLPFASRAVRIGGRGLGMTEGVSETDEIAVIARLWRAHLDVDALAAARLQIAAARDGAALIWRQVADRLDGA